MPLKWRVGGAAIRREKVLRVNTQWKFTALVLG
jgi:hypothetical protein